MAGFEVCYHCEERYSGCHSVCPKYLKEKADWEAIKQTIAENKAPTLTYYDFYSAAYISSKCHKRRLK